MLKASMSEDMHCCVWCLEKKSQAPSWQTIWPVSQDNYLCNTCAEKLVPVGITTCSYCSRPREKPGICYDCERIEKDPDWRGLLDHNVSLYRYNHAMQELIAQWKYRGDAALALIFQQNISQLYEKRYANYIPVPIPLSPQRLHERGFNQAEQLASWTQRPARCLSLLRLRQKQYLFPVTKALTRVLHEEKQSKKTRRERLAATRNPFAFTPAQEVSVNSKNIVLFDDIFTTGMTLRKAAKVLKEHGAKRVCSITLARG
ncbi:competence protein ComFC [Alteribacillus persepolensis]|uniref:Competence protein ComFC n=1 Tax=Alteribacillus persepolensis TaxID=568899 RepID=A0A1G8AGA7_9BACI|nr:ComF family protein [Alteribacillus persepolensis]SDH19370.1 competence protein ComFC [Alteribacillus persepolensis]